MLIFLSIGTIELPCTLTYSGWRKLPEVDKKTLERLLSEKRIKTTMVDIETGLIKEEMPNGR